ncbi:MAG: hypothetical protein PHD97_13305 [Bacteroidales bacterium]|nr:hypothetical protein [Bacteroidales bacterium]
MFIDFPCSVHVENSVLRTSDYPDTIKHSMVFISVCPEHASGGGCRSFTLDNNKSFTIGNYTLMITDSLLKYKDSVYTKGQIWSREKYRINLKNLWWIYKDFFELKNLGYVRGYIDTSDNIKLYKDKVIVIKGHQFSNEKLNPLTIFVFILSFISLILNFILLIYYKKYRC